MQVLEAPRTDYARALVNERREAEHLQLTAPAEGADSVWLARPVSSGKPLCCRA